MKKKYMIPLILSLGIFFCNGCSKEIEREDVTQVVEVNEDGLEEHLRQYSIQWMEFDKKIACDVLLDDFDESAIPPEQENGTTMIEVGDSSLFLTSNGALDYQRNQDAACIGNLFFYYLFGDLTNMEVDLYDEAKRIQTESVVQKAGKEIGLIIGNEEFLLNRASSLTREELRNLEEVLKEVETGMEVVGQWQAEEYMALEYVLVKDNIAIMGLDEPQQPYVIDIWGAQAAYIQAILGDGKILYLSMRGMVDIIDEGQDVIRITREQAVEIAKSAEADIVSDDVWKNQEIWLEYVPVPDWSASVLKPNTLTPYWCIVRSDGELESVIRINAVTGGNLAYGE